MIQSHAESMKKILGALQDLPANQHSQSSPIPQIMAELAVIVSWQILKGSQDFLHTFSMALYCKWDVRNGFTFVHIFFSLISDGLDGVLKEQNTPKFLSKSISRMPVECLDLQRNLSFRTQVHKFLFLVFTTYIGSVTTQSTHTYYV